MPNPPYTVPPIHDGQELLTAIRISLRANIRFCRDGLTGDLGQRDALTLILTDSLHMLDVVKASKDTI